MINTFKQLGLDDKIIEGLRKQNINEPTAIQSRTVIHALANRDIIGQSQTGSGKTLAYLLPLFQKIDKDRQEMQAIVLAPTHELAMQIKGQTKLLAEMSGIPVSATAIIGQVNIKRQIEKLKEKPHIIIGSTGRILELIQMRKINAQTVKTIVIDEGDRLLDENNLEAVKGVIKATMKDRQLMVFSATLNQKIQAVASDLMKEPEVIRIEESKPVTQNIPHMYFVAEQRDKIEVLRKLVHAMKPEKAIVFINKSEEIQITTLKLQYHKLNACGIYGTASKEERKKAMEGFRIGKFQILVASDLVARGLDIQGVTHIFNLDLPEDYKEYLHRVGRTSRMGKPGVAVSIITRAEKPLIKRFERDFRVKIEEREVVKGTIVEPCIRIQKRAAGSKKGS